MIFGSCLDLAKGFEFHCRNLLQVELLSSINGIMAEIDFYVSQIRNYQRRLRFILEQARGTERLVCISMTKNANQILSDSAMFRSARSYVIS